MKIENLIENGLISIGQEYGDSYGTYSKMEDPFKIRNDNVKKTSLNGNEILIREKREFSNNKLIRDLSFYQDKDIKLYDMVSRFVIRTKSAKPAKINNKLISHCNSENYYQYPAKEAFIPINDKFSFRFTNKTFDNYGFDNVMYIRDAKSKLKSEKQWILHHRLISKPENELSLIFCTSFLKGKVKIIDNLCPKFIKKKLFRIREKSYPNFPIMAISLTKMVKEFSYSINTSISVTDERYY